MRGHLDGHDALEPERQVRGIHTVQVHEAHVVLLLLTGVLAIAAETALAVRINDVRIAGLGYRRTGLATADGLPVARVATRRAVLRWIARHHDRRVVLLTRVQPVREAVVDVDLVELGGRLVVLRRPSHAAVERDVGTTVVGLNPDVRVVGVDPHVVVVPVRCANALE